MKKIVLILLFFVLPISLYSQQKSAEAAKKPPPETAQVKSPVEEEDGSVMIDSVRGEEPSPAAGAKASPGRDEGEDSSAQDTNAIPSSFGDVKGTLVDAGRHILVFQADDGVITFVQIVFSRNGATWKPAGTLYRSRE